MLIGNGSKRYDFVTLLKFIAIVMIINSHAKWMYPEKYSMLACGGAWGCGLFFFCSGFTMANTKTDSFWRYVLKRFFRIYPAVVIWYALTWKYTEPFSWWFLLWPNYWFLRSIIVYYVLFYPVVKYCKHYLLWIMSAGALAVIVCYFVSNNTVWMIDLANMDVAKIYYFVLMLLGLYLRNYDTHKQLKSLASSENMMGGVFLAVLLVSFICCYGLKFMCMKHESLIHLQVLFPVVLFATCFFIATTLRGWKMENVWGKSLISYIAAITLELYIVQQSFIYYKMAKPLTGVGAIFATMVCAMLLHSIVSKLGNFVKL